MSLQAIEAFARELQELTLGLEACAHTYRSSWLSEDGRELELLQQDNITYIGHIDGLCHGSRPEDWRIWVSAQWTHMQKTFGTCATRYLNSLIRARRCLTLSLQYLEDGQTSEIVLCCVTSNSCKPKTGSITNNVSSWTTFLSSKNNVH